MEQQQQQQGSMLWTLFLMGICFCLIDVAYIIHYVEFQTTMPGTQQQQEQPSSSFDNQSKYSHNHEHHPPNRFNKSKHTGTGKKSKVEIFDIKTHSTIGNDDTSPGMPQEEANMMRRQLNRHSREIYGLPIINNRNKKNPSKKDDSNQNKLHEQQENGAKNNEELTEDEWHTIVLEKRPILELLYEAHKTAFDNPRVQQILRMRKQDSDSMTIIRALLDAQTLRELPTWKQVTELYGDEPRIYGLDQCETFQQHSDPAEHFVSTAGTFNSGTNLMAEYLIANCHMQDRMDKYGGINRGIRWQVPWGKHSPPGTQEFRIEHKAAKDKDVSGTDILPAVTIRDPYVWMQSMCRHEYESRWHHDPNGHCPNLIPDEEDMKQFGKYLDEGEPIPLHIKYNGFWKHHLTLIGQWNDWYREYWDIKDVSRLIVRFEDLLFFPRKVTETVCKCAGGSMLKSGKFKYILDSAKKGISAHGPMESRTGFIKAIIKYGNPRKDRHKKMTLDDLHYAKEHLDSDMMEFFRYKHPQDLDPNILDEKATDK